MGSSESHCCAESNSIRHSVSYETNLKDCCDYPRETNKILDPRSPTENIDRTPMVAPNVCPVSKSLVKVQLMCETTRQSHCETASVKESAVTEGDSPAAYHKDSSFESLKDPRSPAQPGVRTPISYKSRRLEDVSGKPLPFKYELNDPRCSTQDMPRAPLIVPEEGNCPLNSKSVESKDLPKSKTPGNFHYPATINQDLIDCAGCTTTKIHVPSDILDPRSPTFAVDRTPLSVSGRSLPLSASAVGTVRNLYDPRSPTSDVSRTPLNIFYGGQQNLRKTLLMTNALTASPITKMPEQKCGGSSGNSLNIAKNKNCNSDDDEIPDIDRLTKNFLDVTCSSSMIASIGAEVNCTSLYESIMDMNKSNADKGAAGNELQTEHRLEGRKMNKDGKTALVIMEKLQLNGNSSINGDIVYTELAPSRDQVGNDLLRKDISRLRKLDSQMGSFVKADKIDLRSVNSATKRTVQQTSEDITILDTFMIGQTPCTTNSGENIDKCELANIVKNALDGNSSSMKQPRVIVRTSSRTEDEKKLAEKKLPDTMAIVEQNQMTAWNQMSMEIGRAPFMMKDGREFEKHKSTNGQTISQMQNGKGNGRLKSTDAIGVKLNHKQENYMPKEVDPTIPGEKEANRSIKKSVRQIRLPTAVPNLKKTVEQKLQVTAATKPLTSQANIGNNKKGETVCRLPKKIPSLRKGEGNLSSTKPIRSPLAVLCYQNNSPNVVSDDKHKSLSPKKVEVQNTKIPRYYGTPPARCDRIRKTKATPRSGFTRKQI